MDAQTIVAIIFGIIALIVAIPFGVIKLKGKDVIQHAKNVKADYDKAVADGTITDVEKAKIADEAILLIQDLIDLWQIVENAIRNIAGIIKRK